MSVVVVEVGEGGWDGKGQGLDRMYLTSTASRAWPRKSTCSAGWGIGYGDLGRRIQTLEDKDRKRALHRTGTQRVGLDCVGTKVPLGGWGPGDKTID